MRPAKSLLTVAALATGLTLASAFVPSDAQAVPLVPNGSFETGTDPGSFTTLGVGSGNIADWSIDSGSVDYIGTYWTASDGNRSLDMSGNEPGKISTTITGLVNGVTYLVLFDIAGNPDQQGDKALDAITASTSHGIFHFDSTGHNSSNMGWLTKSFTFTATGPTEFLAFQSQTSGPWGPALDNVRIEATPLPAALPLFAGGLGVLSLIARRRKRTAQAIAV